MAFALPLSTGCDCQNVIFPLNWQIVKNSGWKVGHGLSPLCYELNCYYCRIS